MPETVLECHKCGRPMTEQEASAFTCPHCGNPLFGGSGMAGGVPMGSRSGLAGTEPLAGPDYDGEDDVKHLLRPFTADDEARGQELDREFEGRLELTVPLRTLAVPERELFVASATPTGFVITPRSVWGARPPRYVGYLDSPVGHWFCHHGADFGPQGGANATVSAECAYMRICQNFHMDTRGWSDIAYSFCSMQSGRIYEARGFFRTGGHTLNWNSSSLACECPGNYDNLFMTQVQIDAERWLIAEAKKRGAITSSVSIRGHRDVGTTACPGAHRYAQLPAIRVPYAGGDQGGDDVAKADVLDAFGLEEKTLERVGQFLAGAMEHGERPRKSIVDTNDERLRGFDFASQVKFLATQAGWRPDPE